MLVDLMINQQEEDGTDDDSKVARALFALVAFGVGEVIGGLLMGLVNDYFGNKKTTIANVVLVVLCFTSTV